MSDLNPILVTGSAGFIGFHLSLNLLDKGHLVVGIDNLNDYYDPLLKRARLEILRARPGFTFVEMDVAEQGDLNKVFKEFGIIYVVNLAAQAGVRYSLVNPHAYLHSNLHGFLNVLEACRHANVKHLVYASSSSVYGANRKMPFSVHDNVDHPLSLYAASKKSNELMAHTYSNLFNLPTTGLRFFTVYGPFGRPDMALFLFTKSILEGRPIAVYNQGQMKRDFTYVADIVEGVSRLIHQPAKPDSSWNPLSPDPATSFAPYRLYNIGNNQPVELMEFIRVLEEKLGKKAIMEMLPLQDGDVTETFADIVDLEEATGYRPQTNIRDGIGKFVDWYRDYYNV